MNKKHQSLYTRTPASLKNHIYKYGWTKANIVENCLNEFYPDIDFSKMTLLEICEKYQQDIAEYLYEEYASCQ